MTDLAGRDRTVFRPAAARALSIGWFVVAAAIAVDVMVRGEGRTRLVTLAVLLVLSVAAYGVMFRPSVEIDDERVTVRNVFRDAAIPWHRVTDITARWSLTVHTERRHFGSWAVTGRGATELERARRGAAPTPVTAHRRNVDFASFVTGQVVRRWRERPPPTPETEATDVELRWAWEFVVPLVVSLALLALAVAL